MTVIVIRLNGPGKGDKFRMSYRPVCAHYVQMFGHRGRFGDCILPYMDKRVALCTQIWEKASRKTKGERGIERKRER